MFTHDRVNIAIVSVSTNREFVGPKWWCESCVMDEVRELWSIAHSPYIRIVTRKFPGAYHNVDYDKTQK